MKFNLELENINYLKLLYKDANDFLHCVKASIKHMSDIDIYACVKKEEWENIPAPQNISVGFACDNGLYKGESVIKYTKFEEPYLYFSIKTPEEIEFQQNREYFRVRLNNNVVISYRTDDDEIIRVPCNVYDLSANGLRVKLNTKTYFPQDVFIDIYFDNREIRTKAKFVRTDEEDEILKAAFHFIDLSENDMDYIARVCIRKQIEDKRNSLE